MNRLIALIIVASASLFSVGMANAAMTGGCKGNYITSYLDSSGYWKDYYILYEDIKGVHSKSWMVIAGYPWVPNNYTPGKPVYYFGQLTRINARMVVKESASANAKYVLCDMQRPTRPGRIIIQ